MESPTATAHFIAVPMTPDSNVMSFTASSPVSNPEPASESTLPTTPATAPQPRRSSWIQDAPAAGAARPRLDLTWRGINVVVKTKTAGNPTRSDSKRILTNVSGNAPAGQLTVLMGPSGAGKSTLLDCLSLRNRSCTGQILVNGSQWTTRAMKSQYRACYVQQDDLFYENLTTLEHLELQAEIRMPRTSTAEERHDRVQQILTELGLVQAANTPIGNAIVKGLSGGQRKRLTLATELLSNPSLLFVDEPTSGLDSFMAEAVVAQMQTLARHGRTIITTIHQPSSTIFQLFDRLVLLVNGAVVYNGVASETLGYFASVGYPCPSFMNASEHFMQQLAAHDDPDATTARVRKLIDAWSNQETTQLDKQSPNLPVENSVDATSAAAVAPLPTSTTPPPASQPPMVLEELPGLFQLIAVLSRRNLMRLVRDTVGFRARLGSSVFITLMVGLVFLQLKNNQQGIQNFTGAIFFMAVNQFMSSANPEFITVPLELPLIMREHESGLYHVLAWYAAKNVSELPFQFLFPMFFVVPAYFMVGFGASATTFFTFYLFCLLIASCATGIGLLVSTMTTRVEVAPIIGILFMLPFLLFGGLFLNSDSTPAYFIWLQQISPIKYGHHGLMRGFWSHVSSIECSAGSRCAATNGDDVLESFSIHKDRMWSDIVILIALNLAFRVVGALFLLKRAYRCINRT